MYFKTFTRLFLLLGTLALLSAPLRADEIQIGEGTSTTYDSPINTYYNYSLTEMIYTAEAIENAGGGAGTISSISFEATLTNDKDFSVVVFLKHVSRSSFSQSSDFESLTEADKVYTGTMRLTQGWVTLELDTPFDYDGTSNLLIAFDNNTGSNIGSSGSFKYTTASEKRLWKYQNDYTNPDPLNYSGSGSVSTTLPNLKLEIATTPVACAKPKNLTATDITARTASLDWTKGSDDQDTWEIYLTQSATHVPTDDTPATFTENVNKPFNLSNLTPETDYYAYVRANCGGENGKSKWSTACHFTTLASCFTPTVLTCNQVTSNEAVLAWNAGEGQDAWEIYLTTTASDVPTAATQATHHNVTSNPYTLTNLTPQTKYYAYVRANCGAEDGKSQWSNMCSFTTPQVAVVIDAESPSFTDGFENAECGWVLVNGDRPNQWCQGSATNNGGSKALYISNDGGVSNAYTASYQAKSMVYATKNFTFDGIYTFSFDWKCYGSYSDYFRVALVPASVELNAGTAAPNYTFSTSGLPQGWIALDGGSKLNPGNPVENWGNHTAYEIALEGSYMMVFAWLNTSTYGGYNPPVAIDNVSINYVTCPRPTNLASSNVAARTAILTWTENGTADNWTLQYATDADFSTNLMEANDGFVVSGNNVGFGLTGLNGDTHYYARVKSNCDSDWSDVCDFTTNPTCAKPTLSYVSNSNTAHSGSVQWTGSTADAFEIAYRPGTTDFDPSDYTLEGVTRVQLENVNTYTLENLDPETKYYIYIQANCGEEDGKSQWSNRVIFTTLATCIAPSSLTKETTTSSSVTLSWTKGADDQDAWQFRYKKTTDSEYTYLIVENQSEPLYTIDGLDAATEYKVNVRAWCDEDDQSKWSYANQSYDLTITTECAELTLPYFNDFEGALETSQSSSYPMPKCWTRIAYQGGSWGNYSYYPYVFTATSGQPYNHGESSTSGHSMRFYRTSTSQKEASVLPALDAQYEMKDVQVRFWARLESYNSNKDLAVGVMTDPSDINTFEAITPFVTVEDDVFREYTVTFENYQGEGRYIAITYNTSSLYNIYVDDVTVELIPSCRIPKDLEAEVDGDSQAMLTWAAGKNESAWNVQYKKASDPDWSTIIPVTETSYTLTGLKRGTVYEARVQANCNAEDQSDWTEAVSFATDCGIRPIATEHLMEDFESIESYDFPPTCWTKFNHEMSGYSYWYLSANNSLGSNAAYSSYNQGYAFLVMPKMHIDGNATLSFDYLIGSGTYDESCSVVVSNSEMTFADFNQTIWAADANNLPTGKANATVALSDFDNQDICIAFKYKGSGTSGCTWYIDNVQVYVADKVFVAEGNWNEASNWQPNGVPTSYQSVHINADATIPSGYAAEIANVTIGTGSLTIADGGQLNHSNDDVLATVKKHINAYSGLKDNYYLISSPLAGNVNLSSVPNMLDNDYDLYDYHEPTHYWLNQETASNNFTEFKARKGYLYANSQETDLEFTGILEKGTATVSIPLSFTEGIALSGFNLVGNPFAHNVTSYSTENVAEGCYRMNDTRENLMVSAVSESDPLLPAEGFFVKATAMGASITLNAQTRGMSAHHSGFLRMDLSQNGKTIDRLLLKKGGEPLEKLSLNENSTILYAIQDQQEMAIVPVDGNEQAIFFKAAKDGVYTLSISAENANPSYLHLIDNLTGADIDLLVVPSYTFIAKTTDYASRFRLVFIAGSAPKGATTEPFAFISNGEIILTTDIETQDLASLQIIDMMGRVLYLGAATNRVPTSGMVPGLYVLRLICGDAVNTQKIVLP